jgi:hypothetical protein
MFTLGAILFILSGLIVFGSDRYYKSGRIKSLKSLLKIKTSGLVLAVIGALLMFYGNN